MDKGAIETMMSEHRQIESVLDALDAYVVALFKGGKVERTDLLQFIRFIEEYADAKHHAKEEAILFVAMGRAGFPTEGGPIGCMVNEHDEGRALIKVLVECAKEEAWCDDVIKRVAAAAIEFSGMLRSHIYKEDNMLYRMAKEQLSPEQMDEVDKLCAEKDAEATSAGTTSALLAVADDLIARYGCARAAESGSRGNLSKPR